MLNRVVIKNFQSLEHIEFVLGNITVITGETDHGKSAIIRAIDMCSSGRLVGEHVTFDKEFSETHLFFDDISISCVKGKRINSYIVGSKKYSSVGRTLPVEVINGLNMKPISGIKKEVYFPHIATQKQSPFILSTSSSAANRIIGNLTGIDVLTNATYDNQSEILKLKRKRRFHLEEVQRLKQEYDPKKFLVLKKLLLKVRKLEDSYIKAIKKRSVLLEKEKLTKHVKSIRCKLQSLKKQLAIVNKLPNVDNKINEISAKNDECVLVENIFKRLSLAEENLSKINKSFKQALKDLKVKLDGLKVCPFCLSSIDTKKINKIVRELIR